VALAVGRTAIEQGLAQAISADELEARIDATAWNPEYSEVSTT
jgi:malic enzyme